MRLSFVPGALSEDDSDGAINPQWEARWAEICDRLTAEAEGRGGRGYRDGDNLTLVPPHGGQGERIRVQLVEAESARVRAGWTIDVFEHFSLVDGSYSPLVPVVVAIMDGAAQEIAETSGGRWVGVCHYIPHAAGSVGLPPELSPDRLVRSLPSWRSA